MKSYEKNTKNPFNISFGRKPLQMIPRLLLANEIVENFLSDIPSSQIYMIVGVRGSGKTVMMTDIASTLREYPDWITVELNPERDLLQSLAAKLNGIPEMHALFLKTKFDFSALGLGVSIERATPVTDIEQALSVMLEQLKKTGKKLLVTIDEVTNHENIRIFASSFQIFLRQEYPIYLLMTGLYENISNLQDEKSLTFLYRAPKALLEPLNFTAMKKIYQDTFSCSSEKAAEMATLTKGYSFAFQVLGYICWEDKEASLEELMVKYDQYLSEYVYEKIWSECSAKDKTILTKMAENNLTKVKDIRELLKMSSGDFSVYRERLKRKGVINTSEYGKMSFALPRFEQFILAHLAF